MAKNKFIHDEMVRAWLDGEDIQYSTDGNNWEDLLNVTAKHNCLPYFSRDYKYRFKPKTIDTFGVPDILYYSVKPVKIEQQVGHKYLDAMDFIILFFIALSFLFFLFYFAIT